MVSYQEANLDIITQYYKDYRLANSEKNKEYLISYNTKPEVKKKKREYYDDNIQSYRDLEKTEERKKYRKEHNKNSIYCKWRSVLSSCLKRLGKHKEGKSIDLLGYSASDLYYHMIPLFTEGMSWENHGEWHIDHKKPVSKFDNDTHPSIVNALSNLQPLWAVDNYKKYNNTI